MGEVIIDQPQGVGLMGNRRMLELMLGRRARGNGDAEAPRAPSEGRDGTPLATEPDTQAPPSVDR